MNKLRTYLVTGLLVWVPLGITVFLVKFMVDFMDRTLLLLPVDYRPETVLGFHIPGLGIVLALSVLLITGLVGANFIGRKLVQLWESMLQRIPLVRSVYSAAKSFAVLQFVDGAKVTVRPETELVVETYESSSPEVNS